MGIRDPWFAVVMGCYCSFDRRGICVNSRGKESRHGVESWTNRGYRRWATGHGSLASCRISLTPLFSLPTLRVHQGTLHECAAQFGEGADVNQCAWCITWHGVACVVARAACFPCVVSWSSVRSSTLLSIFSFPWCICVCYGVVVSTVPTSYVPRCWIGC